MIFVTSCTRNTQSQTSCLCLKVDCVPIYGHESDWNMISDDLARNIYRHNLYCENN